MRWSPPEKNPGQRPKIVLRAISEVEALVANPSEITGLSGVVATPFRIRNDKLAEGVGLASNSLWRKELKLNVVLREVWILDASAGFLGGAPGGDWHSRYSGNRDQSAYD